MFQNIDDHSEIKKKLSKILNLRENDFVITNIMNIVSD